MKTVSPYTCVLLLLMLAPAVLGQGRNGTLSTTLERRTELSIPTTGISIPTTEIAKTSTDLSMFTTEEDWSPFPPGDVLNNPYLRRIRFCVDVCFNEETLQGLRNLWPYVDPYIRRYDGKIYHGWRVLRKAKEIAVNPTLRAKLYCSPFLYPHNGKEAVLCFPGNSTLFLQYWKASPIGRLQDNIPLSVFNATLAFLVVILGIFGNILIIVAILTKKELKSSTNLLLLGMAVADTINSVTVVFHGYLQTFLATITNAVLGPHGCAIMSALKEFSQLAAVNHLTTLSFERYFAICWPMKTSLKFTSKKTVLIVFVNWFIAAVQLIPHILLKLELQTEHYAEYMCIHRATYYYEEWISVIYNLSVYLVLPLPILCFNYTHVVKSLFTSIKRSREMTGDSSGQTNAEKARLRLTYMLITLVVIYIVTVTPGRILDALYRLEVVGFTLTYFNIVAGAIDLVRGMNSCTNVVVYAIISRQFRTAFKEVLCHCWRKRPGGSSGSGTLNGIEETPAGTMENQV